MTGALAVAGGLVATALGLGEGAAGRELRDFNEWRFVLQQPFGQRGAILATMAAATVIALAVAAVVRSAGEAGRLRRVMIVALRAGSALLALALFLQPAIQLESVTRLPNRVAVLVDGSASMALAEQAGGPTRAARAARLLDKARPAFASWRGSRAVDFYLFSSEAGDGQAAGAKDAPGLRAATLDELARAVPATGDATRIREALAAVRARYEGRDLAGVLLLSDGVDTGRFSTPSGDPDAAGQALDAESRDFLRSLDVPVHTAWTGEPGLRDLAISGVLADDFAFARNAVKIEVQVQVHGGAAWKGRRVPIVLRQLPPGAQGGTVVRSVDITLGEGTTEDPAVHKVTFEFTPDRVGKFLYEVSAPLLEGDAVPDNNRRLLLLKVIRDKVRALLVAGRPSWDERYLRGLLKHNPNVDLISFFILRTPSDVESASPDEMSLIPFPTEELFLEQLRSFDVVFLQNFNYAPYGMEPYLERIKSYVEAGGGLAMIGGDVSFTSGGYAHTPVADVLPVELLEPGPEEALVSLPPFAAHLTAEGRSHPVTALRLDAEANAAEWSALAPLDGCNRVARARPGASVLLTHPSLRDASGAPMPVLSVIDAGKGRTLALTSDSSWRWGFGAAGAAPGAGAAASDSSTAGDARAYQRLWENAIRWLVHDPELRLLRVESDQGEYRPREHVRLAVRAFAPDYKPAAGVPIDLSLTRVGAAPGERTAPSERSLRTDEQGRADVDLGALDPGGYRVVARASRSAGVNPGAMHDEEVFLVRGASAELARPEADSALLRAIAAATGGSFVGTHPSVGTLEALPLRPPEVVRVNKHRDVELWSSWLTLAAAAVLLALEWILRRGAGLP